MKPILSFVEPDSKNKAVRAIAQVKGGSRDKEILYLYDETPENLKVAYKPIDTVKFAKEIKSIDAKIRNEVIERFNNYLKNNIHPDELAETPKNKDIYRRILEKYNEHKNIKLDDDSTFVPLPNADENKLEVFYIVGASGSGKSFFARMLSEKYKKLYPEREVYLISKLKEDDTLDSMKLGRPLRVNEETFIDDEPKQEEFENSLVIFDDIDGFEKQYKKLIQGLVNDIATTGRHSQIKLIYISHSITDYSKTRLVLNEATHVVCFPSVTTFNQLNTLLEGYVGLTERQVRKIKRFPSRWIMFYKQAPNHILSEKLAMLTDDL